LQISDGPWFDSGWPDFSKMFLVTPGKVSLSAGDGQKADLRLLCEFPAGKKKNMFRS
jgi:hypothetical protein